MGKPTAMLLGLLGVGLLLGCAGSPPPDAGPAAAATAAATLDVGPFVPDDVFRIDYVISPRIAPDGEQVVFVREVVDRMDDRWHGELWSASTDDGTLRQLTRGHHYDSSPRISPDGRSVAFVSDRSGSPQVYVKALDEGPERPARRLTRLGMNQDPWGLTWSPDGRTLAFVAREFTDPPFLGELSPPPPGATWASPPRVVDRLVYRQDGRGYVEPGCERLFLVAVPDPESGEPAGQASGQSVPRRATNARECLDEASLDLLNHGRSGVGPSWSPDGRSLWVAANRRTDAEQVRHPIDLDLYEVDLASGEMTARVSRPGLDHLPTVSPDGTRIAFLGFADRGQAFQRAEVYVANRDGSGVRSLTADLDRDADSPQWSADGAWIYFSYHDRGTTRIARVASTDAGSGPPALERVAAGVSDGYSAYDGGGFSLARDGRVAFVHSSPVQAGEIAVSAAGEGVRRLTGVNDELLAARPVAPVEEVVFASVDGREIQGWLMRPPPSRDGASAGPPPLVLDIHGGPFLNWGTRFDLEKQILASQGFAVLYVNPRGSTGYGEEFANLLHHDYPGDDLHDLLGAVDLLVQRGDADPERLFVTGGSGGGLLTFALLAETPRFRAAVALYPLVNWTSFVLTTDLAPVVTRRWLPGLPWEHPEHYVERSPIWKVDRMSTPTMIIAGEEDFRTPISEAEQIFAALRLQGVDSVLVRLPETPHFAERRPSHYRARIAYGLHWFRRHLETPRDDATKPVEVVAPPDL